jgi:hypothetical protein
LAEHTINLGHRIQLQNTTILSTKPKYMHRTIREAIEIELNPNNMNREDGFCLSKLWKAIICFLKDRRRPHQHEGRSGFSTRPSRLHLNRLHGVTFQKMILFIIINTTVKTSNPAKITMFTKN